MRKKDETTEAAILALAKEMTLESGAASITIRAIAQKAGIATGTVYNYYQNKDDILLALTEAEWRTVLSDMQGAIDDAPLYDQIAQIYHFLNERMAQSAGMLMSSLGHTNAAGLERMKSMQQRLLASLIQRIEQDHAIDSSKWHEHFTMEQYAAFILKNMMLLLQDKTTDINFLIELIKRTLY